MIDQIEVYGPAWADITRANCGPRGELEGRDQAKLKDKARNLKEKFIKYRPKILTTIPRRNDALFPHNNFVSK